MKLALLLVAALTLCGCQTAHISKQEAIAIARRVAVAHQEPLERYRPPRAHYYAARALWQVSFEQKVPYTLGQPETYHYFAVHVDDRTGEGTYEAGLFK
jgi:hypothetical protein